MINKRTAIILCGGKGSRLGSIGKKIPKTLVEIHSKPILWYIIKNLLKNKFNHLILPVGYKSQMIRSYIDKNKDEFSGAKIDIINTGVDTIISKRIFKIKSYILSENFILLNGDAIFDFNIFNLFENHISKNNYLTFLGTSAPLSYGVVIFRKNKIHDFKREIVFNLVKQNYKKHFTGYVYSGMSIMNKKIMNASFKNYKNFEQDFYPKIIKKYKTDFRTVKGEWFSIDNEKDINSLNQQNTKKYISIKKIFKKLNEKKFLEK